jgi:hypothetical protein
VNVKRVAWYLPHKKTADIVLRMQSSAGYLLRGIRIIGAWRRLLTGVK